MGLLDCTCTLTLRQLQCRWASPQGSTAAARSSCACCCHKEAHAGTACSRLAADCMSWELPRETSCLFWQVNHSPSFTTDSRLDREVKDALLCDTINLINVHACNKRKVLEEDKQRVKERLLQAPQAVRVSRYCPSLQCCRSR